MREEGGRSTGRRIVARARRPPQQQAGGVAEKEVRCWQELGARRTAGALYASTQVTSGAHVKGGSSSRPEPARRFQKVLRPLRSCAEAGGSGGRNGYAGVREREQRSIASRACLEQRRAAVAARVDQPPQPSQQQRRPARLPAQRPAKRLARGAHLDVGEEVGVRRGVHELERHVDADAVGDAAVGVVCVMVMMVLVLEVGGGAPQRRAAKR